jgi:hypothetical protein
MTALSLVALSAAAYPVAAFPAQPGSKEEREETRSRLLILVEVRLHCAFS